MLLQENIAAEAQKVVEAGHSAAAKAPAVCRLGWYLSLVQQLIHGVWTPTLRPRLVEQLLLVDSLCVQEVSECIARSQQAAETPKKAKKEKKKASKEARRASISGPVPASEDTVALLLRCLGMTRQCLLVCFEQYTAATVAACCNSKTQPVFRHVVTAIAPLAAALQPSLVVSQHLSSAFASLLSLTEVTSRPHQRFC